MVAKEAGSRLGDLVVQRLIAWGSFTAPILLVLGIGFVYYM